MPSQSTISRLLPGTQLYKYKLRKRIGRGSFGEVWLAYDQAVNHEYAIKILEARTTLIERLREARIGHQLDHPNVVRVHQADVTRLGQQEYVVLAMDYVADGPITNLANSSGYLALPNVIRLARDILRGLEYLHTNDLIHNDIKPENVLIGPQGQGMLTDYGIVGLAQEGVPIPTSVFYKIHAAPEVVSENLISAQSDIYQVGLTLFRLLVGVDVLRRKFYELGEQDYYKAAENSRLFKTADFPAYVPSRLLRIVKQAAHPSVDARYSTALQMRRELEKLSYPGHWTVDHRGEFVGHNGAFTYRFEVRSSRAGRFDVVAFKRNLKTGRETRCLKYCHSNITNSTSRKKIERFVKDVVEGI